jgi:hypothetical protein
MSIYLEIDSTYRNRYKNPNPAEFELSFDKSGTDLFNSFDPVSDAVPIHFFDRTDITITGYPFSNSPSQTLSAVIMSININVANKTLNWYRNSMIQFSYGTAQTAPSTYRLIKKWEYMSSNSTKDFFRVYLDIPILYKVNNIAIGLSTFITKPFFSNTGTGVVPYGYEVSSLYKNYYVYNETKNIYRSIISYDGRFTSVTINRNNSYSSTDITNIRKNLPIAFGTTVNGSTVNMVILSSTDSRYRVKDAYKGMFIRFTSGANINVIIGISGYTGSEPIYKPYPNDSEILIPSYTAILLKSLSTIPSSGTTYEILEFSRDNYKPLKYIGSLINQEVCYNVRLINLTIPNIILESGGTIASYPYFFVEFHNQNITTGDNKVSISYSNNPNSVGKLFMIPVSDFSTSIDDAFLTLDKCNQVKTIRLNPSRGFKFGVYLPNGEVLTSLIKDTVSPFPPDQYLQFSANFVLDPVIN